MLNLFQDAQWDAVVAVPCGPARLHARGFSPPLLIADAICRQGAGAPKLRMDLVARAKQCAAQASLSHARRLTNVKGAFGPGRARARGQRVLLVDDVITTGATSQMVALEVLKAGASKVDLFAAAQSPHWQQFRWVMTQLNSRVPDSAQAKNLEESKDFF